MSVRRSRIASACRCDLTNRSKHAGALSHRARPPPRGVRRNRVIVQPVDSASARADSRGLTAVVVFGVLAGIGLRVYAHVSSLGTLDGDEAVWGLMARHFRLGELSAFLWGQGYGGTQEVLATAPLVALFGTSTEVIRVVPLVCTGVAAAPRLADRETDRRRAGGTDRRSALLGLAPLPRVEVRPGARLLRLRPRLHLSHPPARPPPCRAAKPGRRSAPRPRARAWVVADPAGAPHRPPRARVAPLEAAGDLARRLDRAAVRRARRAPLADLQRRARLVVVRRRLRARRRIRRVSGGSSPRRSRWHSASGFRTRPSGPSGKRCPPSRMPVSSFCSRSAGGDGARLQPVCCSASPPPSRSSTRSRRRPGSWTSPATSWCSCPWSRSWSRRR